MTKTGLDKYFADMFPAPPAPTADTVRYTWVSLGALVYSVRDRDLEVRTPVTDGDGIVRYRPYKGPRLADVQQIARSQFERGEIYEVRRITDGGLVGDVVWEAGP